MLHQSLFRTLELTCKRNAISVMCVTGSLGESTISRTPVKKETPVVASVVRKSHDEKQFVLVHTILPYHLNNIYGMSSDSEQMWTNSEQIKIDTF